MNAPKSTLDELRIERKHAHASPSNRWLWPLAVIFLIAVIAAAVWFTHPKATEVTTAPVRAVTSGGGELTVLNASGYVTARRMATISAKITGKVVEVLVEEGMRVKAGRVLARLDDSECTKPALSVAASQRDSAVLNLEETRALLKQAENEYKRTVDLAQSKIASQSDLDKAEIPTPCPSERAPGVRQEGDVTVAERQVATLWKQDSWRIR